MLKAIFLCLGTLMLTSWQVLANEESASTILTPQELKIHRCLSSAGKKLERRRACLVGTPYKIEDSGRTPSSVLGLIAQNAWIFADPDKLAKLTKLVRGLKNMFGGYARHFGESLVHHRGVALSAEAFAGIGGGGLLELVNHDHKFGLFCAPYVQFTTDVGVAAGVSLVRSISCPTNQSYVGGFLSFGVGVSGELIGLPVDIGTAYSFGINHGALLQRLRRELRNGNLDLRTLAAEVATLHRYPVFAGSSAQAQTNNSLLKIASNSLRTIGANVPTLSRSVMANLKRSLADNRSLGHKIKAVLRSREFKAYLTNRRLEQLGLALSLIGDHLTGCDSVLGSASGSLSLSPVAASISLENYHLLTEFQPAHLRKVRQIASLQILNPDLLSLETLTSLVYVANQFRTMPSTYARSCGRLGF